MTLEHVSRSNEMKNYNCIPVWNLCLWQRLPTTMSHMFSPHEKLPPPPRFYSHFALCEFSLVWWFDYYEHLAWWLQVRMAALGVMNALFDGMKQFLMVAEDRFLIIWLMLLCSVLIITVLLVIVRTTITPCQCLWCCRRGRAIVRVYPVHLMNVERRQAATDPRPSQTI